jgi:ABC-type transport system involved in cytochrome c biogenesis permease subunit
MGEVLTVFSAALLLSMCVLHFAMGLRRRGAGWAVLDDALVLSVALGAWFTVDYLWTLPTAQRDLPPALQSYWFAPHIIALIFSYATLGIAGILCLIYFASRFWSGVLDASSPGEGSTRRSIGAIAWLALAVTAGLCGVLFWFALATPEWASAGLLYAIQLGGAALMTLVLWALHRAGRLGGARPGRTFASLALIFAGSALLPFGHFVTLPVLLACGLVFLGLRAFDLLPERDFLAGMEKQMDEVSFSAFSVGFPFLTGGLFMGAFWAQEAWANYWGWDSKENSALISWLIYIAYFHLRMLGGYRGEKAMAMLMGGALSIFMTFQIFGYLPDSQKNSLHKYTDDAAPPMEGQQGPDPDAQARAGE